MNNNAFQKMVRDRASGKSTKEIARAAVEDEFQRNSKKRRRGGRAGDCSSDSDSGSDDDRPKKSGSELSLRPQQVKGGTRDDPDDGDEDADEESNYRDRAKERRDGDGGVAKTGETADDDAVFLPLSNKKGLDLTLARKARQELKTTGGESHDESMEIDSPFGIHELPSVDQAKITLQKFAADPSKYPFLSSGLSEYLIQYSITVSGTMVAPDMVFCGVAGKLLQRTRLEMAMDSHPANRPRAWEIPRELVNPNAKEYSSIPILSDELHAAIYHFSSKRKLKPTQMISESTVVDESTSNHLQSGQAPLSEQKTAAQPPAGNEGDEDDDIFGGLDDYVPSLSEQEENTAEE